MQMGVPVIASRTSSIPEVTGQAAVLIDPYDTSELADALAVSLTDQVLRDRCSALGYEQFQKFSWSSCADAVRALCQELS